MAMIPTTTADAVQALLRRVRTYDDVLNDPKRDGSYAVPQEPTGDDYSNLYADVVDTLVEVCGALDAQDRKPSATSKQQTLGDMEAADPNAFRTEAAWHEPKTAADKRTTPTKVRVIVGASHAYAACEGEGWSADFQLPGGRSAPDDLRKSAAEERERAERLLRTAARMEAAAAMLAQQPAHR